jgi:N-acetylneuraminic acid mutarotase
VHSQWGMGAGAPTALNDVHVYSIEACSWERPKLQSVPSGRHGHSAVVAGNSMLVFGGYSSASHNDMWRLDLIDFHWHALAPKGAPPCPRWRHTAVVTDAGGMYVFGGNTRGSESENLNDMYCYDIERNQWSQASTRNQTASSLAQGFANTLVLHAAPAPRLLTRRPVGQ